MAHAVARRGAAVCTCTVSLAVRIAAAAEAAGLALRGATFFAIGEPSTPAKVRRIEASGARCIPFYNFVEAGLIGAACAMPGRGDRLHLVRDSVAAIDVDVPVPASTMSVSAFCFTTLQASAPKLLLNVESDDHGCIEKSSCDCLLGKIGYNIELSEVRSYRKLTGEGVTLVGSEVTWVQKEVLPERFGGSPLDYQLVEEEDESGLTLTHSRR